MGQQVQSVKMPQAMREALQRRAAAEGRSVSEVIKDAVQQYLDKPAKPAK